jgi:hypothetical protein
MKNQLVEGLQPRARLPAPRPALNRGHDEVLGSILFEGKPGLSSFHAVNAKDGFGSGEGVHTLVGDAHARARLIRVHLDTQ